VQRGKNLSSATGIGQKCLNRNGGTQEKKPFFLPELRQEKKKSARQSRHPAVNEARSVSKKTKRAWGGKTSTTGRDRFNNQELQTKKEKKKKTSSAGAG